MKLAAVIFLSSILLAGCASTGALNNNRAERILNRWEGRITTADVCSNEEYLSCTGITSQQCMDASNATGAHCRKFAKKVLLKLGDKQGKDAFKTCVYTYHRNQVPGRTDTGKFSCDDKIKTLWW